jgi:hypothetical protein
MKIRTVWLGIDIIFTIFSIVIIALVALLISQWFWIFMVLATVFIPFAYHKKQEDQSKKRKYVELIYFSLIEGILAFITIFLPLPWNIVMIAIIIALPITIISVSVLDALFKPTYEEFGSQANHVEFLKAQPYFCETCKTFLTAFRGTCENCGVTNSLRKATKKDYEQNIK